jgi:hypothetical protein
MSETLSEVGAVEAVAEPAAPAGADAVDGVDQLAGGAAAGEATAGAEPAAPAAPETPAVDPVELQAQLEYMQSQYSELANYLQSLEQPQQQQAQQAGPAGLDMAGLVDEFGQLTPEGLLQALAVQQKSITQAIEQRFQQFAQPFEAQREEQAYNEGIESAKDILGDNVARFGEFASDPQADEIARDRVLDRAGSLLSDPSFQSQYGGNTPRAAEIAIQRAAEEERTYLNSVRGQGAAQAANRLSTLANAASEPGNGATGGIAGVPEFKSPQEVVQFYAQQARQIDQNGGGAAA